MSLRARRRRALATSALVTGRTDRHGAYGASLVSNEKSAFGYATQVSA